MLQRAIQVLVRALAPLPTHVVEKDGGDRWRADRHDLIDALASHDAGLDPFLLKEIAWTHRLGFGNFFARIVRGRGGALRMLDPIHPTRCRAVREGGRKVFYVWEPDGELRHYAESEIFHFRGPGDSICGISPVRSILAPHLELSRLMEQFARHYFGYGAFFSGFITHPEQIGPQGIEAVHKGISAIEAGGYAVLDEGMKITLARPMPLEDAAILDLIRLSAATVASYFGIPRIFMGDPDGYQYGTAHHATEQLVTQALMPEVVRWEHAVARQLVPPRARGSVTIKQELNSLLRGDPVMRAQYYESQVRIGALSADEVRALEDRAPRDDGRGGQYLHSAR
ncbi:MAG: phage portal protein, partial [Acidobacteriota bacterium]